MKRLNTRFLLIVFGAFLASGILVAVVHHFQVQRQSSTFLTKARKIRDAAGFAEGVDIDTEMQRKLDDSLDAYRKYIAFNEDDADAFEETSEILFALSKFNRAYADRADKNMTKLLLLDPGRHEIRRKQIKVAEILASIIGDNAYFSMQSNAQILLDQEGRSTELLVSLAKAQAGLKKVEAAKKTLQEVAERSDAPPEAFRTLAQLLYEDGDPLGAVDAMDSAMKKFKSGTAEEKAEIHQARCGVLMKLANDARLKDRRFRDELITKSWLNLPDQNTDPGQAEVYRRLVNLAWIVDGRELLRLAPTDDVKVAVAAQSAILYGNAFSTLEPVNEAAAALESLIENGSKYYLVFALLGDCKSKLGELRAAIETFDEMLTEWDRTSVSQPAVVQVRMSLVELCIQALSSGQASFTPEEVGAIIDRQVDWLKKHQSDSGLQSYQKVGIAPLITIAEAKRLYWIDRDYAAALEKFEKVQYLKDAYVDDFPQADVTLDIVRCFDFLAQTAPSNSARTNYLRQASQVLRKALLADQGNQEYRRTYAELLKVVDPAAAEEQFQWLIASTGHLADKLNHAKFVVAKTLNLPDAPEKWTQVNRIIDSLKRDYPDNAEVDGFYAECKFLQEDYSNARDVVEQALSAHPDETALHQKRIALAIRDKNWESAVEYVDAAIAQFGDGASWRLLKAQILSDQTLDRMVQRQLDQDAQPAGNDSEIGDLIAKVQALEAETENWEIAQREQFKYGLLLIYGKLRIVPGFHQQLSVAALRLAIELREMRGDRSELSKQWIDTQIVSLAFDAQDLSVLQAQIEALNGRSELDEKWGAISNYAKGLELMLRAQQLSDPAASNSQSVELTTQALEHLEEALLVVPDWPDVRLRRASVYSDLGRVEWAIGEYELAFLYRRLSHILFPLARLHYENGNLARARELLNSTTVNANSEVGSGGDQLMAQMAVLNQNYADVFRNSSVDSSQSAWQSDPLWSANILLVVADKASKQNSQEDVAKTLTRIEELLQSASAERSGDSDYWIAKSRLLLLRNDTEGLAKVIEEAVAAVPENEQAYVRAMCLQLAGDNAQAEAEFLKSIEQASNLPQKLAHLKVLSRFYIEQTRLDDAIRILEQIVAVSKDTDEFKISAIESRQALALVLISNDPAGNYEAANNYLDENNKLPAEDLRHLDVLVNKRLRGQLLGTRTDANSRTKLIELYEGMIADRAPILAQEKLALARAYESIGNLSRALALSKELVDFGPEYLADYVRLLMENGDYEEAKSRMTTLIAIVPDSLVANRLQTRLNFLLKEYDDLIEDFENIIDESVHAGESYPTRLIWAAQFAEYFADQCTHTDQASVKKQLEKIAEQSYKRYAELDPSKAVEYAKYLARKGRVTEGLNVVGEDYQAIDVNQLLAFAGNTLASKLTSAQHVRLIAITKYLHEKMPGSSAPLQIEAGLHVLQVDFDRAAKLYEEVLKIDPTHEVALNNLAMIQANHLHDAAVAGKYIDLAISKHGEKPNLLDTKGFVRLEEGKYEEAVYLFRKVMSSEPSPIRRLHLAYASFKAGDKENAYEELRTARQAGLKDTDADVWEKKFLDELEQAFRMVTK